MVRQHERREGTDNIRGVAEMKLGKRLSGRPRLRWKDTDRGDMKRGRCGRNRCHEYVVRNVHDMDMSCEKSLPQPLTFS